MQSILDKKRAGYFKLATWCARSMTFIDGKKAYPTEAEAMNAAKTPGKYRVSAITENARTHLEPFIR